MDLVLSSGFLAFARHAGFLAAVEDAGLKVDAVCGTSSGSVVAALWASGMPARQVAELFARTSLLALARPAWPWQGALSLGAFTRLLAQHLPATFADLPRPFAVGVVDAEGQHRLLTDGPLAKAVTASCAMPYIFAPVDVSGRSYADGGAADRLGLDAWRSWRPGQHGVAHWVERTAGRDVDAALDDVVVVKTPRSGAHFWSLGNVMGQMEQARAIAAKVLLG